ncbi:MAG: diguanylate cyclase [Solidesulfovibrio sp. DCME]|uniref:diguanylate cyclase n=1 Tax=Solidesulfovibrio sp. DCME TaxID=3447380 RepID=UPI003D0D62E8
MAARGVISSFAGLFLVLALCCGPAQAVVRKNVLVLHNFNQDHPAVALYDQGLREAFQARKEYDVRVSAEYLNLSSLEREPGYVADTAAYLAMKYSLWKPDAIALDNAVVPLYEAFLSRVFANVPLVVPMEFEPQAGYRPPGNMTAVTWGVTEGDIDENMALILRLLPGTKTVYLVVGASDQERRIARTAAPVVAKYAKRLAVVVTDGLTGPALLETVARAPRDAAVLYVRFARDAVGETFIPAAISRELCRRSPVPVFGLAAHLLGDGMVGGYVRDIKAFGRFMGGMLLEALDGRLAGGGAPVRTKTSEYAFDWRVLERFGIDAGRLPPGSRVEFKPDTLWETHRGLVLGGVALVVAETFLILGLVVNRARRRRAEAALATLNRNLDRRVRERTRELHDSNLALRAAKEELEAVNGKLETLSRTDSLTGLPNRRQAEDFAAACHAAFEHGGTGYCLAMLDIDHFKRVNDVHGHEAGDRLLASLARTMTALVRAGDKVARWGGEEFLLVLPATGMAAGRERLERLRAAIAAGRHDCRGAVFSVTATIGLATAAPGEALSDVVRRADAALYRGKRAGRNRVETG